MTAARTRGQLPAAAGALPATAIGPPSGSHCSPVRPRIGQNASATPAPTPPRASTTPPTDGRDRTASHPDEQTGGHRGDLASAPTGDQPPALQRGEPVARPIGSVARRSRAVSVPRTIGPFCGGALGRLCGLRLEGPADETDSEPVPTEGVGQVGSRRPGNCLTYRGRRRRKRPPRSRRGPEIPLFPRATGSDGPARPQVGPPGRWSRPGSPRHDPRGAAGRRRGLGVDRPCGDAVPRRLRGSHPGGLGRRRPRIRPGPRRPVSPGAGSGPPIHRRIRRSPARDPPRPPAEPPRVGGPTDRTPSSPPTEPDAAPATEPAPVARMATGPDLWPERRHSGGRGG